MRLLEPINGIKALQGHYLANLIFFVVMITMDPNMDNYRLMPGYSYAETVAMTTNDNSTDSTHAESLRLQDSFENTPKYDYLS
jgi:hypothetical protein